MVGKLQAYDILVMLLLNLHSKTLMAILSLRLYEILLFMQAHGKIPNPT